MRKIVLGFDSVYSELMTIRNSGKSVIEFKAEFIGEYSGDNRYLLTVVYI